MKLLIFFAAVAASLTSRGQEQVTITAHVLNHERQQIPAGDAYLLNSSDSSIMQHVPVSQGAVVIKATSGSSYILKIESQGYKAWQTKFTLSPSTQLDIELENAAALLNEVVVTAAPKQIVIKDGSMILNIQNTPLASIMDPVALMSKMPTVIISPDGQSISVVGKGEPLIYIDNEKSSIDDLKSLAVADIATIELVNNPSSKYEAQGRSVLLINRKKNIREGTRGDLTESFTYRHYSQNRLSANASLRKNKIELKAGIQYNQLRTWEGNDFDFNIASKHIRSGYSVTAVTTRPQFIGESGISYQINNNNLISLNSTGRTQREDFPIHTKSSLETTDRTEHVVSATANLEPIKYLTSRLNFNHKFHKAQGSVFVGAQHTFLSKDLSNMVFTSYESGSFAFSQQKRNTRDVKVDAVRLDIDNSLAHDLKYELGASVTNAASGGHSLVVNTTPPSSVSGLYSSSEVNYAAYGQISGKVKKLGYTGGLRFEDNLARSTGVENQDRRYLRRHIADWFPKAAITIPIDRSFSVKIDYARSVIRQDYTNAFQNSVYINPYFEWVNNPNLNPSYRQDISTTISYKDCLLTAGLFNIAGPVYNDFVYDDEHTHLTRTVKNYSSERGYFFYLTAPIKTKAWNSTNVLYFADNRVNDTSYSVYTRRPYLYAASNNDVKLPFGLTFSLSGWMSTKRSDGMTEISGLFGVDSSLTKTFFKKLTCTMRFENMFASIGTRETFTASGVAASGLYHDNGRQLGLSVRYGFGKLKESKFLNKDVGDAKSRVN